MVTRKKAKSAGKPSKVAPASTAKKAPQKAPKKAAPSRSKKAATSESKRVSNALQPSQEARALVPAPSSALARRPAAAPLVPVVEPLPPVPISTGGAVARMTSGDVPTHDPDPAVERTEKAPPSPWTDPTAPWVAHGPAIACLEISTVARGVVALDQILKRAEVTVVAARTLSPGRYLIVLTADVADIEEAMEAGLAASNEDTVDQLILRDPAPDLLAGLANTLEVSLGESLAIIETTTVCSALDAAEKALKNADVRLLDLRLGAGLSGKGVFSLTGPLHMVEAAQSAIELHVPNERIVRIERVAQPHPDLPRHLLQAEPAVVRGPRGRTP